MKRTDDDLYILPAQTSLVEIKHLLTSNTKLNTHQKGNTNRKPDEQYWASHYTLKIQERYLVVHVEDSIG